MQNVFCAQRIWRQEASVTKLGPASSWVSSKQKLVLRLEAPSMGQGFSENELLQDLGATCAHSLKILMVFLGVARKKLNLLNSEVGRKSHQNVDFQSKCSKSIDFPCCWKIVWRRNCDSAIPYTLLKKFVYIGDLEPHPPITSKARLAPRLGCNRGWGSKSPKSIQKTNFYARSAEKKFFVFFSMVRRILT